jgi:hypothetical protein
VKLVELSGTKKGEYLKYKVNKLGRAARENYMEA